MKTYIIHFITNNNSGWAIVNAHSVEQAQSVFNTQTKFKDAKIVDLKEQKPYGEAIHLVAESVSVNESNLYTLAVNNGFKGSIDEFIETMKGPKGDKGDRGPKGEKGEKGERGPKGISGTGGGTNNDEYVVLKKIPAGEGNYKYFVRKDKNTSLYFNRGDLCNRMYDKISRLENINVYKISLDDEGDEKKTEIANIFVNSKSPITEDDIKINRKLIIWLHAKCPLVFDNKVFRETFVETNDIERAFNDAITRVNITYAKTTSPYLKIINNQIKCDKAPNFTIFDCEKERGMNLLYRHLADWCVDMSNCYRRKKTAIRFFRFKRPWKRKYSEKSNKHYRWIRVLSNLHATDSQNVNFNPNGFCFMRNKLACEIKHRGIKNPVRYFF